MQDHHGGGLVDHRLGAFGVFASFVEVFLRFDGAKRLVHEKLWDVGKLASQAVGKGADSLGGRPFRAVAAQRQTEDELGDAFLLHDRRDALEGMGFSAVNGFQGVCEEAQLVADGDPDARLAVIDAEDPGMKFLWGGFWNRSGQGPCLTEVPWAHDPRDP